VKAADFIASLPEQPTPDREAKILAAVRGGLALPITWMPVTTSIEGHEATIFVSADALAIGEPDDWVRVDVTHTTAQQIADVLGVALPTTKIVDAAYQQATVVLEPRIQTADAKMAFTSRMVRHHREIEAQRAGRTGLVRNVGKDWVLTNRLVGHPDRAANYGWFSAKAPYALGSGLRGWQPLGLAHDRFHVDYSQVLTLVRPDVIVDGSPRDLVDVLRSPDLWGLVSDEGPLQIVHHPGVPVEPAAVFAPAPVQQGAAGPPEA
jgi:hypothetical protein